MRLWPWPWHWPNDPCVTFRSLPVYGIDALAGVDVPELECAVEGTGDDTCMVELQAGDSVMVTCQGHDTLTLEIPHLKCTTMIINSINSISYIHFELNFI